METTYYVAAWTECGCLLSCNHQHTTILEAKQCFSQAGSYVVAVEDGIARALNDEEEPQFQRTPCNLPKPAALKYEPSGYAIMTRVRIGDDWCWTTGMHYKTFEDACAHARAHDVVVRFGSARWRAMLRSRESAFVAPGILPSEAPIQRQDRDTLIEYVTRVVPSPIEPPGSPTTQSVPRFTVSNECAPQTFIEFVLEWISDWEAELVKNAHSLYVAVVALTLTVQKRARQALSSVKRKNDLRH